MNKILIQNPRIINEGRSFIGSVLVEGDKIAAVFEGSDRRYGEMVDTGRYR